MELIRNELPTEKGLLGFVGGPLTLFCYAVEGKHQGNLESAKKGLEDGRFDGFVEKLMDLLLENMVLQARSGADAVAILDTCAGEFGPIVFREKIQPVLAVLMRRFKERMPDSHLVYYSKGTGPDHWQSLKGLPISCLGIDWKHSLKDVLAEWGHLWAIQGNVDPTWLFLDPAELKERLRIVFEGVRELPLEKRQGWVCGLGHGILPKTPEKNVKLFLSLQKELF
jgi:uroporphyrinogen decarboxylase